MDDNEYNYIKKEVMALTRIDLNFYKDAQMQRRLNTYLLRSGKSSWRSYFGDIRTNPAEIRKLKDYLTINVSSFFRDTEKYVYLRDKIFPELLKTRQQLRIWSAGCSRGQEPYTMAMMLVDITGAFRRHTILATDLDRSVLDAAEAGGPYTDDDVTNVPKEMYNRSFTQKDGKHWIKDDLRKRITFKQHNLLADPFETNFDLIVCRNVVIYFTAPVKDKLYQNFFNSLRKGGIMFVGGTEIVPKASDIGFETAGISFYRRNGFI